MTSVTTAVTPVKSLTSRSIFAALAASLMLGACGQTPSLMGSSLLSDEPAPKQTANNITPRTELQKATSYWGQEFQKNPRKLENAMNFAKNLKALGERQKALNVLQQASSLHAGDPELASEYGRLALELDQVSVAERLLAVADNPAQPDWKIISARGTVKAKKGLYSEAIPFYERALKLSGNKASVLNNLAMAYAMKGDPKTAESYLRQAKNAPDATAKINQNLALVLGLQGRYAEAKSTGTALAANDTDTIRSIVKLDPKAPVNTAVASSAVSFKPATMEQTSAMAPAQPWGANVAIAAPLPPVSNVPLRGAQ